MSEYDKEQPVLAEFRAFTAEMREGAEGMEKDELVSLVVEQAWEIKKLKKEKFDFNVFQQEKENMTKMLAEMKEQAYESGYDACCEDESVDKEYLEELEEEIKELKEEIQELKDKSVPLFRLEEEEEKVEELKKLVDEYKKCSLREKEATPQEITDYMKELSSELEDSEKKREFQLDRLEVLSGWEGEIREAFDFDDDMCLCDIFKTFQSWYDFYDPTHMDELRDHFRIIYNNIKDDEWQVYADEGFDPEAKRHELKEGYTHTSLENMVYILETTWSCY